MLDEKINSNEIAVCPICDEPFADIKVRGVQTPVHQIFDTLAFCTGGRQEIKVRDIRPGERLTRTPLAVH